ncbi:unnamed protein product [Darwinula stevensoni]|uniref:Uncharacterized protein n=1 Tax=Darwinula stevensoni TaxID=69355 RepID=A0A7R9A848_9CRUS|nr:unnamed protein product [Darwinula stevensoni]CAG0895364.1 unnamed protein product [Darwinula stevensoni]
MCSIQVESWVTEMATEEVSSLEPKGESKGDVMRIPYMGALRPWRKKRRLAFKATVILISLVLALKQVICLIEEYASFPIITLHDTETFEEVPAPAFTICPKPSLKASFHGNADDRFSALESASVSLTEVISHAPYDGLNFSKVPPVNGETIFHLANSNGSWSERTFWEVRDERKSPDIFKCFTLALKEKMPTGTTNCGRNPRYFLFNFTSILNSKREKIPSQIDVYIHDRTEEFSNFGLFTIEHAVLFSNTTADIFIRSDIIRKLNKWTKPCTMDENHSYVRSRTDLPCFDPILLTKEANHTYKHECRDPYSSSVLLEKLESARKDFMESESDMRMNCSCMKKCHRLHYYIFADPNPNCFEGSVSSRNAGSATLFFSFPSSRVPTFTELQKVNIVDLLSNIGGIVGVCLGVSIITIFDLIDGVCSRIRCKLLSRRNAVIQESKH